jgi:hypothetical protein
MRAVFFILGILGWLFSQSQNLAAFSDYQNRFFIFDDGNIRQLEYLPVNSFETGDNCIAYLTNGNNFKIYHNHISYDVAPIIDAFIVTDNLVSYKNGSQLYVFEQGQKKLLSKYVSDYLTGDSLVAFFDSYTHFFQVYYKTQTYNLEDGLLYENLSLFKVGQNILAYIDAYQNFKVFYQGEVTELMKTNVTPTVEVGRNIMAFIDPFTDYLQLFFQNELRTIESFKPKSFQVGYEKVAFVSNTGDFKLFDNGETYTISSFAPDTYELKDNLLVYQQQGQLFAFYEGENYLIENYIPTSYKVKGNAVAYLDQNGYLQLFKNGSQTNLSYEQINDFQVLRNVVIFNQGMNTTKIYYQGKTYTN